MQAVGAFEVQHMNEEQAGLEQKTRRFWVMREELLEAVALVAAGIAIGSIFAAAVLLL